MSPTPLHFISFNSHSVHCMYHHHPLCSPWWHCFQLGLQASWGHAASRQSLPVLPDQSNRPLWCQWSSWGYWRVQGSRTRGKGPRNLYKQKLKASEKIRTEPCWLETCQYEDHRGGYVKELTALQWNLCIALEVWPTIGGVANHLRCGLIIHGYDYTWVLLLQYRGPPSPILITSDQW